MAQAGGASILHADLDAFYASVEQLLDPSLLGRAVAVGEGVVLAASYEAKSLGVRAGMPGRRARELCPDIRFVGGHFRDYQRLGDQVIGVLRDFTPLVERISIDEAFLDVAGTEHLFGSPTDVALAIRHRVRTEIGLPVSVGVARTKHLAKIASQAAKPDGLVVVDPDHESEFLRPLSVDLIWGVGPATHARLAALGIRTIGDLAATPSPVLKGLLGQAAGRKLGALATNLDPRRVQTTRRASSIGAQHALGRRPATADLLRTSLGYLADRVASRLRAAGRAGRTITVRVRFTGLRSITRSVTLPAAISTTLTLTEIATELAGSVLADNPREREITLLAISVSQLVDEFPVQLELPLRLDDDRHRPGTAAGSARWALDRALDTIRDRFGRDAVGYATVMFSELGGVPDEFRELAEHDVGPKASPADWHVPLWSPIFR
ncbi:DNA polymerase IV [Candidatus Nephthysia bennettiae]|uniref:DNA polymerase IV n=1 Tax=Candidatus Nephthysia bennettiae TaxID=3127016 RepID=A0A934KAD4_9BACT|nr:DNA polymerase IV [Candidatus Dormibacteraeota bacterium]MBJ7614229.1 DNA polymerase IV [Candidatus Dormibacteraeota bacterium]